MSVIPGRVYWTITIHSEKRVVTPKSFWPQCEAQFFFFITFLTSIVCNIRELDVRECISLRWLIHWSLSMQQASLISGTFWIILTKPVNAAYLKYGSQEKISFCCKCSSFLSLTFVEIKKSFTKMLLSINYLNFKIFFSWKKTDKS